MGIERFAAGAAVWALAIGIGASPAAGADSFTIDAVGGAPAAEAANAGNTPLVRQAEAGRALDRALVMRGEVARFYRQNGGAPVWTDGARIGRDGRDMIAAIEAAADHGLRPSDYHLDALTRLTGGRGALAAEDAEAAELLLTDAFMALAHDLLNGRVDPSALPGLIEATGEARDLAMALEFALERGRVGDVLDGFAPQHPQYALLKDAYARYRDAAAETRWPTVDDGETLEIGMRSPRTAQVRARLDAEDAFAAGRDERGGFFGLFSEAEDANPNGEARLIRTGGLDEAEMPSREDAAHPMAADPMLYDAALAARVEAFQRAHALAVDGKVGPNTLAALNQGLDDRADAIAANMERWRWLPNELGERYLLVNVPEYRLRGYEDARETLAMDVIVGRPDRETPQFSDQMEYIVVNPNWNVPYNIATLDKLPKLRSDPGYFDRNNYVIYRDGQRVSPHSVDWSQYGRGDFPFRIVQKPGANNALGTIKFIFPNRHSVYLHDTDSPELFAEERRALSSGCVRVSDPRGLARWVADSDPTLDFADLDAKWGAGRTDRIDLLKPLPVHLAYFTSWAEEDGEVRFIADVYRRDAALTAATADAG